MFYYLKTTLALAILLCVQQFATAGGLLYVRVPIGSNDLPSVSCPLCGLVPGTDLVMLEGTTHSVILFGGLGAVTTPSISLDGQTAFASHCPNVTTSGLNEQRNYLPLEGCNSYRIPLTPPYLPELLVGQEWTTQIRAGNFSKARNYADPAGTIYWKYGVVNLSMFELPGKPRRYAYVSNRRGLEVLEDGSINLSLQLYSYDVATKTSTILWPTPTTVQDPVLLRTGEIAFTTWEAKHHRTNLLFGTWAIFPDGSGFRPLDSALGNNTDSFHWVTSTTRNELVTGVYYQVKNWGAGTGIAKPLFPPLTPPTGPAFGSPNPDLNEKISMGPQFPPSSWSFQPIGTHAKVTATSWDRPAGKFPNGEYTGKYSHFSAGPNNDVYAAYSAGPVFQNMAPLPHFTIVRLPGDKRTIADPSEHEVVVDIPGYHAIYPRYVASFKKIYDVKAPVLQHDPQGPIGTAKTRVGGVSLIYNGAAPGKTRPGWEVDGVFGPPDSNFRWQGSLHVPPGIAKERIHAIQIRVHSGKTHESYGSPRAGHSSPSFFSSNGREREWILATWPVKKWDINGNPLLDPWDDLDTSFYGEMAGGASYSLCAIDIFGAVLFCAPTWHAGIGGEWRTDCGGCHPHDKPARSFAQVAAGQPGFKPFDTTKLKPYVVEFLRDVQPEMDKFCTGCHNNVQMAGNIDFTNKTLVGAIPHSAAVLVNNPKGDLGGSTPEAPLASGYLSVNIHGCNANRSKFYWAWRNARTDGIDNDRYPSKLVAGVDYHNLDIDYTPEMELAHKDINAPANIIRKMAEWIDLCTPVNYANAGDYGVDVDEIEPYIKFTRHGKYLYVGVEDILSGVDKKSVKVTLDGVPVTLSALSGNRWSFPKKPGRYDIEARDTVGNIARYAEVVE